MFIATTALTEFWRDTDNLILLGNWCVSPRRPESLSKEAARVLSNPWDDRPKFYEAASYVSRCSEDLLRHLSTYLDNTHGTTHGDRYWRIIIGPWVIIYIHAVFDRLSHLQAAFEDHSGFQTIVMDERSFKTPADFAEAQEWLHDDPYNLQIFSQLLTLMGCNFPAQPYPSWHKSPDSDTSRSAAMQAAIQMLKLAERFFWSFAANGSKAAIRGLSATISDSWRLAWTSRFAVLPLEFNLPAKFNAPAASFDEKRLGLQQLTASDSFQGTAVALLPYHFPRLYLEGYREAAATAGRFPKPCLIASGYSWYSDEPFKFMAAAAVKNSAKLAAVQFGGGYGFYRASPYEDHERKVADKYLAWGWASPESPELTNAASPRLSRIRFHHDRKTTPPTTILVIATSNPRYLLRFDSAPAGSQWAGYFSWENRFLSALPDEVLRNICFRAYPTDLGHDGERQLRKSFPGISWDDSPRLDYRKIRAARLVVIDHPGTAALEAIAANVPLILYWQPDRWEVRSDAQCYVDRLRDVGILWHSPEEAAGKVSEVYADKGWWFRSEVQRVREEFAARFAMTNSKWIQEWCEIIRDSRSG